MRLEYLNLEKFGIFDGLRLDLSDRNVLLNVVYGPNEAGKSTVLAAIGELLFGMDERTPYNFRHAYGDLRIAAKLTNTAGQSLEFKRRKARSNDLIKPDESSALPDNALLPFLGGLERPTFERMFGLDHERLRKGGEIMLASKGDVSHSLFEAGSGGTGVGKIMDVLTADMEKIGFPGRKGSGRPYVRALERYEAAVAALKADMLKAEVWAAAVTAQAEAVERRDELDRELAASVTKRSALERVRRVAPILRRIDDIFARRAELEEGVDLPEGFDEIWRQSVSAHATASYNLATAKEKLLQQEGDLAALGDAGPWPIMSARMEELMTELGDYRSKLNGLPNRERDIETANSRLADLARQLGSSDVQTVVASTPSAPAIARVRTLVGEWNRLDEALKSGREEVAKAERAVRRLEALGREIGEPRNPAAAAAALEPATTIGDISARLARLRQDQTTAGQELAQAMAALGRCALTHDTLAKTALPSLETISEFEREFTRIATDQQRLTSALREFQKEARRLEGSLEALRAGGEVPTPDALTMARDRRNRNWNLVRRKYVEGGSVSTEAVSEFAPDGDLVQAFERNVLTADSLADRRMREAERIERFSTLTGQLLTASSSITAAEAEIKGVKDLLSVAQGQWEKIWDGTGVTPGTPTEMRGWTGHKDAVLAKRVAWGKADQSVRAAEDDEKMVLASLNEAATLLSMPIASEVDTSRFRQQVKARFETASKDWNAYQDNQRALLDASQELQERRLELEASLSLLNSWESHWAEEMPALGLAATTTPVEAEAALTVWHEIDIVKAALLDATARRTKLKDDITAYEGRVADFVSDLGESVADLDTRQSVSLLVPVLFQRQREMAQLFTRATDARESVRRAVVAVQAAEDTVRDAVRDQQLLRDEHQLPEDADIVALTRRSADRRALDRLLETEKASLAAQSDGHDEMFLRSEASDIDADEAAAEVGRLEAEIERLRKEWLNAAESVTAIGKDLAAMSSREGTAAAAQQANEAAADMTDCVARWLRLKAASIILNKAVERYRSSNQHPLIKRASDIFATMTSTGDNPILRLAVSYTDEVHPVLVGIRREGKPCDVAGMSEGTLDQLYLALRIAAIELYVQSIGAIPFIADDLFITSDDERTVPGILALAELGRQTQVLLFTHHRYVVEAAKKALKPEELKIHHLRATG